MSKGARGAPSLRDASENRRGGVFFPPSFFCPSPARGLQRFVNHHDCSVYPPQYCLPLPLALHQEVVAAVNKGGPI